ncbi:MAG: hypothetical protein ACOVSW_22700 [Candidatus Kapaibacteriota bacterium]
MKTFSLLKAAVLLAVCCFLINVQGCKDPLQGDVPRVLEPVNWQQTNGPYGGSVRCLVRNGTTLFAGTIGGGVFRSFDNGTTWQAANNGLTSLVVESLSV